MAGEEDNTAPDGEANAAGGDQQAAAGDSSAIPSSATPSNATPPSAIRADATPPETAPTTSASTTATVATPAPAAAKPDPSDPEALVDADVLVTKDIRKQVAAALELAEYLVRNGIKRDNVALSPQTLRTINVVAGKVRLFEYKQARLEAGPAAKDIPPKLAPVYIKASEWSSFEQAYYALASFSAPVTIDTLRDTRETSRESFSQASPAQRFTRQLWLYTVVFAVFVIAGGAIATGADNDRGQWSAFCRHANIYVPILVPWLYGALGACAYLLRTAHDMIAKRCFDVRRQPEYFNRMLLGAVSGGSIVLLVSPSGDDTAVKISAAALGFLAGYSNDLLFNAIERVTTALMPKIGLDTVQKQNFVPKQLELPTGGLTLNDLMTRMEKAAKPGDKELYRSLIEKLRDRL